MALRQRIFMGKAMGRGIQSKRFGGKKNNAQNQINETTKHLLHFTAPYL